MDALKLNISFSKLCRVCLDENKILTDIYTVFAALNGPISNALQKCAPIHINKGDELPDCICDSCLGQLLKSYQFQVLAVDSEKVLYQRLKKRQSSELCNEIKSETSQSSTGSGDVLQSSVIDDIKKENRKKCELGTELQSERNNLNTTIKLEFELDKTNAVSHESVDNNHFSPKKIKPKYKIGDKSIKRLPRKFSKQCTEKSNIKNKILQDTEIQQKTSVKKLHQCDICKKYFSQKNCLVRHKRRHTGEKPFHCEVCNKRFSRMCVLKVHMKIHTGEAPHQCDVCGKCFAELGTLNVHKRKHTGEKPYQCDVCSKCFSHISTLHVHLRNHTGAKPHRCDVCSKSFSQKINLITHKRQHTGEKPYQCDVCNNKWFSHKSALNRHKQKHTGVKPHQCDVCNKCFSQKINLTTHRRQHTGEKPYQCDVCSKCFSRHDNLTRHKRKHTCV